MGTKVNSNYESLLTFTRASKGHALRPVSYGDDLFDSDTSNWSRGVFSVDGTLVYSANQLTHTLGSGDTSGARWVLPITCVVGEVLRLTVDSVAIGNGATSGGIGITANSNGSGYSDDVSISAGGTEVRVPATATTMYLTITTSGSSGATTTVTNVTVKKAIFDQPDGTLTLFEHPDNIPRVEWDADRNRLGLLVEESRTNLVTYSEDFSQWDGLNQMLPFGSGSTVNATTAPNGTLTADLLVPNTTNSNSHFVRDIVSVTVGNDYTFSVYVKAAGYTTCSLRLYGTDAPITNFDLLAETTDQSAATITNVGGGWYRCTLTGEATSTGSWHYVYPNSQSPFAGDGTSGIYIYGAQVEAGSFPTSYIKNEGTSSGVTRSADVASIPVADFGYNQSAGTFFIDITDVISNNNKDYFSVSSSGSFNPESFGLYGTPDTGSTLGYRRRNSAYDPAITSTADIQSTGSKVALSHDASSLVISVDGVATETSSSNSVDTITEIAFGGSGHGVTGDVHSKHIKSIKYYPRRLTNAQLVDLTS